MKKISFVLLGVALLLLSACTSQETVYEQSESSTVYNGEQDDTCPPEGTYALYTGESLEFGDHLITIQDITIGSADIDIDGSSSYISTGSSSEINGVTIAVLTIDTDATMVTFTASC